MEACVSNPMVSCAFPNYNGMKVVKFPLASLEAPSAVGKLKDWISFYSPATRGKGCTHSKGKSPRTQEQWWLFLLFVTVLHAPFYLSIWLSDQSFYLPFLPFSPCFPCAVTASLCSRSLVDRGCSHCHAVGAAQGHGQAVLSCTSSLGRSNSSLSLPRERRMNHPLGFYRCGLVFLFC